MKSFAGSSLFSDIIVELKKKNDCNSYFLQMILNRKLCEARKNRLALVAFVFVSINCSFSISRLCLFTHGWSYQSYNFFEYQRPSPTNQLLLKANTYFIKLYTIDIVDKSEVLFLSDCPVFLVFFLRDPPLSFCLFWDQHLIELKLEWFQRGFPQDSILFLWVLVSVQSWFSTFS